MRKMSRQCVRRCQRHDTAHAAPAHDERTSRSWLRRAWPFAGASQAYFEPGNPRIAVHPDESRSDADAQYDRRDPEILDSLRRIERAENRAKLQADQYEREHVQHEHREVPDCIG